MPRPESVVVEDSVKREPRSAPASAASAPAGGCNDKQASTIPSWTATSGCISAYLMFQYCSYVCCECRHISWHSSDAPISTEAGSNHRGESRGGQAAGWRRSAKCSVTHEGPLDPHLGVGAAGGLPHEDGGIRRVDNNIYVRLNTTFLQDLDMFRLIIIIIYSKLLPY